MPVWLISALRMLASGLAVGAGAEAAVRAIPGGLGGIQASQISGPDLDFGQGLGIPHPFGLGPHTGKRRRRRRRALTASDRADIAFITGLLGPSAGSKFAAVIGAKN